MAAKTPRELESLPNGWDGYDGIPPIPGTLDAEVVAGVAEYDAAIAEIERLRTALTDIGAVCRSIAASREAIIEMTDAALAKPCVDKPSRVGDGIAAGLAADEQHALGQELREAGRVPVDGATKKPIID